MLSDLKSVPIHAIMMLNDKGKEKILLQKSLATPKGVQEVLFAPRTGAYIRGLAKQHALTQGQVELLALTVLEVAVQNIPATNFSNTLAQRLKIDAAKAALIAREVQHDLLSSITSQLGSNKAPGSKPNPTLQTRQEESRPSIEATVAKINQQAIEINKQMLAYQVAENNGQNIEEERRNYIRNHEAYSVANLQKPHIAKTRTEAERENILTYGSREQIKALLGHQEVKNMMSPRERKRVQSPKAAAPPHTKTADMKNVLDLKSQTRKNPPQPPSLPPNPNHRP